MRIVSQDKDYLESLENDNKILYGIIFCKED